MGIPLSGFYSIWGRIGRGTPIVGDTHIERWIVQIPRRPATGPRSKMQAVESTRCCNVVARL